MTFGQFPSSISMWLYLGWDSTISLTPFFEGQAWRRCTWGNQTEKAVDMVSTQSLSRLLCWFLSLALRKCDLENRTLRWRQKCMNFRLREFLGLIWIFISIWLEFLEMFIYIHVNSIIFIPYKPRNISKISDQKLMKKPWQAMKLTWQNIRALYSVIMAKWVLLGEIFCTNNVMRVTCDG